MRKSGVLKASEVDPTRSIEEQLDEQEEQGNTQAPELSLDEWIRTVDTSACDPKDAGKGCSISILVDRQTYELAKEEFGSDDFTRVWLPSSEVPIIILFAEDGARFPYLANDGSAEPLTPPAETSTDVANRGNSTASPARRGRPRAEAVARTFANADPAETSTDVANRGNSTASPARRGRPRAEAVARTFANADPAERIGRLLIADHYPELAHQPIRYIFTSVADTVGGEAVICRPTKISGFAAWLANGAEDGEADPFFVILISQTHWDSMPQRGKEAFLDTALSQFKVTKSGALKMGQLDIRESSAVLARHGMYSKKLKDQAKLLKAALDQPVLELAS